MSGRPEADQIAFALHTFVPENPLANGQLAYFPAVDFAAGRNVWDKLRPGLEQATNRRAAIAYAGGDAPDLLPLDVGDIVIVDASDETLAAGSTHPNALAVWLNAGVTVWSLPDLHAKVILAENADGTRTVVVGSTNASAHSNVDLLEAAVISTDDGICDAMSAQLDEWASWSDRVDQPFLDRARSIYRTPRPSKTQHAAPRTKPLIDQNAPLWIGQYGDPTPMSDEAVAVITNLGHQYGSRADVWSWGLNDGDEATVRPGQNLIMVYVPDDEENGPDDTTDAYQPARIVRVTEMPDGWYAFLVADPNQPTLTFRQVREAVESTGTVIDWDAPLTGKAASAVYTLWNTDPEHSRGSTTHHRANPR